MFETKKLFELVCSAPVEYKTLDSLLKYEQPGKYIVSSTNYIDAGIPVLTAGQSFLLGYTDEKDGIYEASKNKPTIIFDDFTTSFHWVDFPFKIKSSAMKMLTPRNENINFRYVYHAMKCLTYEVGEHSRQWISKYSLFKIPVPPIEIQNQIANILDKFDTLLDLLNDELENRIKQFDYVKDCLFDFETSSNLIYKPLRELVDFKNGKGHEQSISSDGDYVVVNSKFISSDGKVKKFTNEQICPVFVDDILMVMSDLPNGKALAKCYIVDKNDAYSLNQRIGCFTNKNPDKVSTKYLFYILNRNSQLLRYDNGVDQTNLKKDDILDILIPLPDKCLQDEIAKDLDVFNEYITSEETGLPAEISARQKQYDYYREQLMMFKELEE